MRIDKYGNPIFDDIDIFNLLYTEDISIVNKITVENLENIKGIPNIKICEDLTVSIPEFDNLQQNQWFMPKEFIDFDIETYIINLCPPWDPQMQRVKEELTVYKGKNMLNLLKWLRYFVETARTNNIVWGVGRGSSVSSYVLFLLGVHKIDSILYNLDYKDFLR